MDTVTSPGAFLPAALLAEMEALAASQDRSVCEILCEAVELYVQDHRSVANAPAKRTPKEAAARMLEMRKGHVLPEGETIRSLMTYGRK